MRRLFLLLTAVLLLVFALTSCGGGGSAGGDTPSASPLYYANWWCTTNQCSSVMGGNSGSAGPFISLNACEQWRQNYILTSVCETSPGGGSSDLTPPTISSSNPSNGTTGVAVNTAISATFSEAMDSSTINTTTFTVKAGSTAVPGTVSYSGNTATFTPTGSLAYSTSYTATVTTGANDAAGNALASNYVWTFTTTVTTTSTTLNIYKDGFYYNSPNGRGIFGMATSVNGATTANVSMTDDITGDNLVLELRKSSTVSLELSRYMAVQPYSDPSFYATDESEYLTGGHLHFNIKLALPSSEITDITLVGSSATSSNGTGMQSSSVKLNPSNYSTSTFTHVSIPLSTLYPPVSISKFVNCFFEIDITISHIGSNVPVVYLNDIKWTSN